MKISDKDNCSLLTVHCSLFPAHCSLFPAHCSLLAIDSATSILSVAVSRGDKVFYKEDSTGAKQSESAMVLVDTVLNEAGLKPQDLNGVICNKGPGSFTGLRIGYSIAKGLALALSIPFAAVPSVAEIKKEEGHYYYPEKRGYARELLAFGSMMDFCDNSALFAGPEY